MGQFMYMNVRRFMLILCVFAAGIAPSHAEQIQKQFITSQEVREWSMSSDADIRNKFSGFVLGIHDAFNELFFCTQSSVSGLDIELTARAYLSANSQLRHKSGADVVRQSLSDAYKCGKR